MQNKMDSIKKFYNDLLKDKKIFDMLRKELVSKSKFDEEFITENLLPSVQKINQEITWKDILEYEKEKLRFPTSLSIDELENISGGKASNVILNCGLLTLMGLTGIASNTASAEFIPFTETKEFKCSKDNPQKLVDLGEVPFYLQADHLVDGILWFKHPNKNVAFFILDRKINDEKKEEYSCKYYNEIKKFEYRLFDIDNLQEPLKTSFTKANTEKFNSYKHLQSLQLTEDNPLYNFSRFFNPNYRFDDVSTRQNLSEIPMYASVKANGYNHLDWDESIKEVPSKFKYAQKLADTLIKKISWKIAHRIESDKEPQFNIIESSRTLNIHYGSDSTHTGDTDKDILRNDGFTFFTLQVIESEPAFPNELFTEGQKLQEAIIDFTNIPLVSCSKDMLPRLRPGEVNIFYEEGDPLPEKFPCFNGSSEDVKDQIVKYYVNQYIMKYKINLTNKDFEENNIENSVKQILKQINWDCLEVRIPTKVAVDKWISYRK